MGSIKPLDPTVHVSTTQERNFNVFCNEKVGIKSVLGVIIPDLDPRTQVNLASSVPSKIPNFKIRMLCTVDATDICNVDFVPPTRANTLSGMRRSNVTSSRLGFTHDF